MNSAAQSTFIGKVAGLVSRLNYFQSQIAIHIQRLPYWNDVERAANRIARPIHLLAERSLQKAPALNRWEWLLETRSLARRNSVVLAFALVFTFWRGLQTTNLGHIGTDTVIYPLLGAISSFNPFLGITCGLAFGLGDFLQKLYTNDIYGTFGRNLDYWGAMLGYIVAYSSVMIMGCLPGVLSRVGRCITRTALQHFQNSARTADGAVQSPEQSINSLLEQAGSLAAAALGGYATMHEIAPVTEAPAFYFRSNPDVSCHLAEAAHYLEERAPIGAAGASLGTLTQPAPAKAQAPEGTLTIGIDELFGPGNKK